jgi:hypothetical protein
MWKSDNKWGTELILLKEFFFWGLGLVGLWCLMTLSTIVQLYIGGHDRMVVGFITTYAICAYHHYCCEF